MKKRVVAILMATVVAVGSLAGCGSKGGNGGEASTEEGKVINIYSWNDGVIAVAITSYQERVKNRKHLIFTE